MKHHTFFPVRLPWGAFRSNFTLLKFKYSRKFFKSNNLKAHTSSKTIKAQPNNGIIISYTTNTDKSPCWHCLTINYNKWESKTSICNKLVHVYFNSHLASCNVSFILFIMENYTWAIEINVHLIFLILSAGVKYAVDAFSSLSEIFITL